MHVDPTKSGLPSIDFLRRQVVMLMSLDHVRLYFGYGTWYAEPTDLTTTSSPLFFMRWLTHFCAPVFVFLSARAITWLH